jgi:Domain of unknown function (DUF3303)
LIFQIVHTHTNETCPARSPEDIKRYGEWWNGVKSAPGIKVLTGYVSPMDHVFYITVEADDYASVARAFGPLNTMGSGQTIPVITLDQAMPLAEGGAFRMQ